MNGCNVSECKKLFDEKSGGSNPKKTGMIEEVGIKLSSVCNGIDGNFERSEDNLRSEENINEKRAQKITQLKIAQLQCGAKELNQLEFERDITNLIRSEDIINNNLERSEENIAHLHCANGKINGYLQSSETNFNPARGDEMMANKVHHSEVTNDGLEHGTGPRKRKTQNLKHESTLEETEMSNDLKASVICTGDELDLSALAHNAAEHAEEVVRKIIQAGWKVTHFNHLPEWLQDNDFLTNGHRPPLPSFTACFKSIFRIHTETGNIWTHLLGCLVFIIIAVYFLTISHTDIGLQEKLMVGAFFAGAIICLGFSCVFHTLSCHSLPISKLFAKLDYCGISFLIMGSFVPWVYFNFYCHFSSQMIYLGVIGLLGVISISLSLRDKFSESEWRPFRTGVFMVFGLSGVVPAMHYGYMEGWLSQLSQKSIGWLALSGLLYIMGALFYANRVPERWFPGKCNIWFQSHQIFHLFVLGGALVHYYGILEIIWHRLGADSDHCGTRELAM